MNWLEKIEERLVRIEGYLAADGKPTSAILHRLLKDANDLVVHIEFLRQVLGDIDDICEGEYREKPPNSD